MSIIIVFEKEQRKIRQDSDVNKNAKATSASINTLFNTRDPLANVVANILDDMQWLKETTSKMP